MIGQARRSSARTRKKTRVTSRINEWKGRKVRVAHRWAGPPQTKRIYKQIIKMERTLFRLKVQTSATQVSKHQSS